MVWSSTGRLLALTPIRPTAEIAIPASAKTDKLPSEANNSTCYSDGRGDQNSAEHYSTDHKLGEVEIETGCDS
jgi:hypothetical protein